MGKNLKSLSVHLATIKNFRKLQQGQEKLTKNIKNQIEPKREKTNKQAKQKQQKQKKCLSKAVVQRCSVKKGFFEISQNS